VEWKPSKEWAVGASYGYGTTSLSNFNFQDTTSNISSNINSGNIYGVYRPDKHWKIAALFGYSDFSYSGSRTYLGDTASAKYSASGYTAALQASYDIPLSRDYNNKKNPLSPVRLKPLVGLAWGANQQGSFSESGSGTLVNVQGQTTNSLMGTVGVGLEAPILLNSKKSMVLTPRVGAAYQYDFLANQAGNKSITANLQDDTTTSYTEAGQNRGANNAYLDLGADFQLNPQVALFASVNYQVFTNGDQFGYQGGVRVKF
jgi:outer membrane autotransporter protein